MGKVLVILLVVLLLFGAKKIPELFKGVGEGIKELKDQTQHLREDDEEKE